MPRGETLTDPATPDAAAARDASFVAEFRAFLLKYGILTLAIAFIIGQALNELVQIVVAGLLMPLVNPLLRLVGEGWRTFEGHVGPFGPFLVGQLVYGALYFLVIALFVFAVARYVLRQADVKKP